LSKKVHGWSWSKLKIKFKTFFLPVQHAQSDKFTTIYKFYINHTSFRGSNFVADEYYETPRMSTYLIAFIVCQFEKTSTVTQNGIVVKFHKFITIYSLIVCIKYPPVFITTLIIEWCVSKFHSCGGALY
jgi:hypothetical protein